MSDKCSNETNNSNDIPLSEIYKGVDYDLNTHVTEREGEPITVIGEHFNFGYDLLNIDEFGRQVESSDELGFTVTTNDKGKTQLDKLTLGKYFPKLNGWMATLYQYSPTAFSSPQFPIHPDFENLPSFTFSPHVTAVFDSFREMDLLMETFTKPIMIHRDGVTGADLFNALITHVREKTKSAEFKKRVKTVENNYRRNLKSYTQYFNALLNKWARLLVLRLDFYFPTEQAGHITAENAHEAREHFFNNMRQNALFGDLKGLIWKLEYGRERGHHFHCIFFFDGKTRQQEKWIADQIGQYWVSQISPGGSYNSCHKDPNQYKRKGIGMINYDDIQKREIFLHDVLDYLCKMDQALIVKPSKGRSIGRMEMPKTRASGAGRPRKKVS